MTDYHAELQRLVEAYDEHGGRWPDEDVQALHNAVKAARTALTQPEPEGPTDEDLYDLAEVFNGDPLPSMRRALELWSRPAIEPVPVAERLPGPEDCDGDGRCWLTNVDVEPGWIADNPEQCTNWTHWLPHHAIPFLTP